MQTTSLPHDHGQPMEQELQNMPSVENFQTLSDIFKQLGDGSRLRIFWLLCHCEECVVNLSGGIPSPQTTESRRFDCQPQGGPRSILYRGKHTAGSAAPSHD